MRRLKTLLIIASLVLISCSSEEAQPEFNSEDLDAWFLELYGDERRDFSCTSYKVQKDFLDFGYEDNTSIQVLYSHNLGKTSIWLDNILINDDVYFNYDDETMFTINEGDNDALITFYLELYQLEISYTLADDPEFNEIKFHCLPVSI